MQTRKRKAQSIPQTIGRQDQRRAAFRKRNKRVRELTSKVKAVGPATAQQIERLAFLEMVIEDMEVKALIGEHYNEAVYVQKHLAIQGLYRKLGIDQAETEEKRSLDDHLSEAGSSE